MTEYLTASDLASYLDSAETGALTRIVELTNALIDEKWANPEDPVPASITNIAWAVAVRAGVNPKGLTSWTRNWDDISRTERMEASRQFGVYLTDAELATLAGTTTSTPSAIRLRLPWT